MSRFRRAAILLILAVFAVYPGQAALAPSDYESDYQQVQDIHLEFPEEGRLDYGSSGRRIGVYCDHDADEDAFCPSNINNGKPTAILEVGSQTYATERREVKEQCLRGGDYCPTTGYYYGFPTDLSNEKVPNNWGLKPGLSSPINIYFTSSWDTEAVKDSGGSVYVKPRTEGYNLELSMHISSLDPFDNTPNLRDVKFIPVEEVTGQYEPKHRKGNVVIREEDSAALSWDEKNFSTGKVFPEDGDSLNDFLVNPYSNCGGNDNPCFVAKRQFSIYDSDIFTGECGGNCPIGHSTASGTSFNAEKAIEYDNLLSEMEVIAGWEYEKGEPPMEKDRESTIYPEYWEGTEQQPDRGIGEDLAPKFYMCGPELTRMHGKVIYSPGDTYEYDQFVCNENGWKNIARCQDGVDNDGDGRIDHSESALKPGSASPETPSQCTKPTDTTETLDQNGCGPAVGKLNDSMTSSEGLQDSKVAFYNDDPNGDYRNEKTGCVYNNYKAEIPEISQNELEFTCFSDGTYSHPLVSSGTTPSSDIKKTMKEEVESYCSNAPIYYFDGHDGLATAQIKLNETLLPYGPDFANERGFQPFALEALSSAESSVFGSDAHNYTAYIQKGIPSSRAEPYQDPEDSDSLSDAWTIGNFLAKDNPKIRGISPIYDSGVMTGFNVFTGGYAGNCPSDSPWGVYEGEVRCMPPDHKTKLDYILPDVKQDSNTVGFKLIRSSFQKFYLSTGKQLDGVKGACWRGRPEDRPDDIATSSDAESFNQQDIAEPTLSQTLQKIGQSFNIKVEGVPTNNPGEYTCSWNITDVDDNKYTSSDFESYNWFNHRTGENSAEQIALNIEENIQAGDWPESIKDQFSPSYSELSSISQIPDQVSSDFFNAGGIY